MGSVKQHQIEEAEREAQELEDAQRCPDCGSVRDEFTVDGDSYLICGVCEDRQRELEEERMIAEAEDQEPDFDDFEEF